MPIVLKSGLVLIAYGGGGRFDVYGPAAGPQIGFVGHYYSGVSSSRYQGWMAFSLARWSPIGHGRVFRTRKEAAEALYEYEQKAKSK